MTAIIINCSLFHKTRKAKNRLKATLILAAVLTASSVRDFLVV